MKKINIRFIVAFLSIVFLFSACTEDKYNYPNWEDLYDKKDENAKPRYIWIDAAANFYDFANSKENIARDMKKIKLAGFTDVVVDVRPTTGDVLFKTDAVDQVTKLGYWAGSTFKYHERTATWDYLQAFIDACRELDLKVHAAINTFTGGHQNTLGQQGLLFRDASKKSWASSLNLTTGITNSMDDPNTGTKFFDPSNEDVQKFLLKLIEDLAKYDVDGIFLDRCRFDDLSSDFSANSKKKFEEYIGQSVSNFPNDVVIPGTTPEKLPANEPKYFKQWLEFRAKVVHDFIVKAREKVKSTNNNIQFGVYVGAWYSTYFGVGVNWASPTYDTNKFYPKWASPKYKDYGYADHIDFLLLGAYAPADKIYGQTEWTVQGFCIQAKDKLKGDTKFAGGPDIGNWTVPAGTDVSKAITNTVDAAYYSSDGYFLFDLIHLKMTEKYWLDVKAGIDNVIFVKNNTEE